MLNLAYPILFNSLTFALFTYVKGMVKHRKLIAVPLVIVWPYVMILGGLLNLLDEIIYSKFLIEKHNRDLNKNKEKDQK